MTDDAREHNGGPAPAGAGFSRNEAARVAASAGAYLAALEIAFLLPALANLVASVWPAAGVGLAVLLVNPQRLWPAILGANFLTGVAANVVSGRPLATSLGFMAANILESLLCAVLLTACCGRDIRFTRTREVVALLAAATLANAGTACLGAGVAALSGIERFAAFWKTWWVADGMGLLLVTPLIVSWLPARGGEPAPSLRRAGEWGLFLLVWSTASWLAFSAPPAGFPDRTPPYLPFALLPWAALRLGCRGVSLAAVLLGAVAVTSAPVTQGPFLWGGASEAERLQLAQVYLAILGLNGFLLASEYNERKAAGERLRESENRYRQLVEGTNDLVSSVDGEGRFVFLNNRAEALFGLPLAACLGRAAFEFIHPADRERTRDWFFRLAAGRAPSGAIENRQVHANGTFRTVLWTCTFHYDAAGCVTGVDGIGRDITERKQAEEKQQTLTGELQEITRHLEERVEEETERRVENERMLVQQSKLAAMGEMLGAIAHQWRQPLNVLGLIIQNLKDAKDYGELGEGLIEKTVARAMAQIQHMSKTINDFRGFFQPDREKRAFALVPAVREVLDLLSAQLAANAIECRLTLHPAGEGDRGSMEGTVFGYRNEFGHVVLNLINNAREAILDRRSLGGGDLVTEKGLIHIDIRQAEDTFVLEVRDNGCGIAPEAVDRVFEPYFTTKEEGRGTGLGLYMARVIVEEHLHGSLTAENGREGAVFRMVIPRQSGEQA